MTRNHIDQSVLRRPAPPCLSRPAAGAGPAGLRPPATGTDHRQPGAAPDQPVSLPPCRRIRRPQMARQLRRQPDQGLAELFQAGGLVFDPMSRQRHVPATSARNSASLAWPGTSIRVSTPATRRISRRRRRSISSGHTRPTGGMKLYADDPRDLSRSPTLEHFLAPLRPVHPQLCRCPQTRRQARHPDGRLFRPGGRIRAAGLPHQAARLRRRPAPALHRHHPVFSHGASSGKKVYRSSASSPACTTCA